MIVYFFNIFIFLLYEAGKEVILIFSEIEYHIAEEAACCKKIIIILYHYTKQERNLLY